MNATERKNFAKDVLVKNLDLEGFTQIGDYEYAFPVYMPDDTVMYARFEVKACSEKDVNRKDGTVLKAFDIDSAVAKYQEKLNEKAEKLAKKAQKSKKTTKKKETEETPTEMVDF
jgi:hypothetical protein